MLNYLDIRPDQTIYTHCGGGVAASVPFFALKFLSGFPKSSFTRSPSLDGSLMIVIFLSGLMMLLYS